MGSEMCIRDREIPSGVEVPVGRHTQGTGQECLSSTGSAQDDHISFLLNVRTRCQAEDLLPVQMPFGNILDILHAGLCIRIAGLLDQASEPVAFPRTPSFDAIPLYRGCLTGGESV